VRGHPVLGWRNWPTPVLLALVPIMPWFWLVLGSAVKGLPMASSIRVPIRLLVWMHGAHVGPYLHGLHFCFGLGAFLRPLLVRR